MDPLMLRWLCGVRQLSYLQRNSLLSSNHNYFSSHAVMLPPTLRLPREIGPQYNFQSSNNTRGSEYVARNFSYLGHQFSSVSDRLSSTLSRVTNSSSKLSINNSQNTGFLGSKIMGNKHSSIMNDLSYVNTSLWITNICDRRLLSTRGQQTLVTVDDVAAYIQDEASSVLVMTGAGLSTASGIPDFRSPGTGIYDNLQKYNLPYPEAIFDIQFFMMDPRPFVSLAQELYPGLKFKPNAGHYFIRLLQDHGKLHRVYTQNIDGLERLSGIQDDKLMEAHGSFSSASCTLCRVSHDSEAVKRSILSGPGVPVCGVRGCKGKVKPDIVFFGENLPEAFWRFEEDLHAIDLLLIMGTSLEVYPFASIAESARRVTPRVLVNRTGAGQIGSRVRDCVLMGDIVDTTTRLAHLCGWQRELHELISSS